MAEVAEKHPSLPANYVSLVQLQERWLKEQQRKQREKEDERKQRENEEEELKREKKEKITASSSVSNNRRPFRRDWNGEESHSETVLSNKQIGNGERKTASSSVSNNRRSFYHNRKPVELQIENVREKVEEESGENQKQIVNGISNNRLSSDRKLEESKSENVRVQDEQIDGESKKKKKSGKKNKCEKEEELKCAKEEKQNNRQPFRRNRNSEELQIENVGEKVEEDSGENQKQIVNGERKIVSSIHKSIFRNLKPEGSQSENVRVQGELIDGVSKKKKKRMKNAWKPTVQENLTGGNELEEKNPVAVSEGKEAEKKIPVVVSEVDGKMDEVRVEYRPKSYNHRPVNQTVEIGRKFDDLSLKEGNGRSQRKSYNHRPVNQTVEIGRKFDDLSLKEGNVRSQGRYNRDSGRFGRPRMDKLREGGQMWVIKGERIDTNAAGAGAGAGNQTQGNY